MNLQFFREKANLTQEQLARKIGMSTAMVQSIEAGRRKGSIGTIVQIAKVLGVTTDELLYAHDNTDSNIKEAAK